MAAFLEVHFTVTLMRLTDFGYVESGDREFVYYFAVPDAWASLPDETLQAHAFGVAKRMYDELGERFRLAEPDDPNFLRVKWARARALSADEAASQPWLSSQTAVWEATPCVVVDENGSFVRVARSELGDASPKTAEE